MKNINRMTKILCFKLLIFVFSISPIFTQNIFDETHTRQYAEYLYNTGQYSLAAEEYERAVFFSPENENLKIRLIESYIKGEEYIRGLQAFSEGFGHEIAEYSERLSVLYGTALVSAKDTLNLSRFIVQTRHLPAEKKYLYTASLHALRHRYAEANLILSEYSSNSESLTELSLVIQKSEKQKYKNAYLAAFFSTIVPGSGKIYTRNYTDAFFILGVVSLNAWQAYRGFRKEGQKSVYGWVFGSVSAAFYIGNIFGAAKSARKYNKKINEGIENEVYDVLKKYNQF